MKDLVGGCLILVVAKLVFGLILLAVFLAMNAS